MNWQLRKDDTNNHGNRKKTDYVVETGQFNSVISDFKEINELLKLKIV